MNSPVQSTVKCDVDYGLVSIIMPNYNGEKYLKETIESVLSQTYPNWELLFVDDCSTDTSVELVRSFNDDRIKVYCNESNQGAAASRNRALREANGRWIAFLDSDDLWQKQKLHLQIEFMVENQISFSFTSYSVVRENDFVVEFNPPKDDYDYKMILKHCSIGCSTVIYDREKVGMVYMPIEAEKREDFACWLKILRTEKSAVCFHKNLTTYNLHTNSLSSNKFKMMKYQWNVYRKVEKIPFFKSLYYLANWAYRGYFKYR